MHICHATVPNWGDQLVRPFPLCDFGLVPQDQVQPHPSLHVHPRRTWFPRAAKAGSQRIGFQSPSGFSASRQGLLPRHRSSREVNGQRPFSVPRLSAQDFKVMLPGSHSGLLEHRLGGPALAPLSRVCILAKSCLARQYGVVQGIRG